MSSSPPSLPNSSNAAIMTGTVRLGRTKWMNPDKGFGFIVDLNTGNDIFVHYTALKRETRGWRGLYPNEYVSYVAEESPNGPVATCVTGVQGGPLMCEHYAKGTLPTPHEEGGAN